MIDTIHTSCKNCVFAIYDNITQTDCALKYIEKYKQQNTEIIEAYDNEKEFYIVNKKKCIGYREPKWFKKFDIDHSSLECKISKYNELNKINYVLVLDAFDYSLEDLEYTIKNITNIDIKPQKLIIIRHTNNQELPYKQIDQLFNKYLSIPWRIQTILDPNLSNQNVLNQTINQNAKYRFMLYVTNSKDIKLNTLVQKANSIVHENLKQFQVLQTTFESKMFSIPVYRYAYIDGNNILQNKEYIDETI